MKIFIFRMRDRSKKIGYKRRRYFEITDRSKKIRLFLAMGTFLYSKGISLLTLFVPQAQGDPWLDVFDERPSF